MLIKDEGHETLEIQVGDTVLLRHKKFSKFATKFHPSPFSVTRKKGMMIMALRNGNTSLKMYLTVQKGKLKTLSMGRGR